MPHFCIFCVLNMFVLMQQIFIITHCVQNNITKKLCLECLDVYFDTPSNNVEHRGILMKALKSHVVPLQPGVKKSTWQCYVLNMT